MSHRFVGVVTYSLLCVVTVTAKDADAQNNFNEKYMRSYLPPGDEHYTESWVGQNSSWRHYMSQYSGKSADYQKYLSEYGGPQANYDQYVSLYSSMAGADVTSGDNYMSKGKSQLDAWNKSMVKTYDLYIPGQYENFAEQATEERTENKGQGVGQGTMGEGHGGGGQSEGGSSMPWIPKSGGQETPRSQGGGGGGGSGEVGYEPFAKPWVVQYATDEGGHNAFDYEGKEFASGGMEMGGVQDYADYMNQYAGEWVPADSSDQKSSEQQADAKQTFAKQKSQTDDKSKKATQQTEEKDQKPDKHKKSADDDKSRSSKAQQTHERDQKLHTHKKFADDDKSKSFKAVERPKEPKEKDQKADKHKKSGKDDKSAKAVAFLESAVPEALDTPPHPAQPALPRWSIGKKEIKTHEVPHPAQPVLPQLQSKVAKEAVAEVRHAVKKLQQAAQDTSYAAWTLAKHSPPPKQTEEQKQLAEAMSRLWKVTREPLTDKSLQELENAGRTASSAIARLQDAEMQQLRHSATSTRQKLLKGARDWSDQVQRDARKQENEQLAQEARQAGAQLEKSLSDALSDRTQQKAQEIGSKSARVSNNVRFCPCDVFARQHCTSNVTKWDQNDTLLRILHLLLLHNQCFRLVDIRDPGSEQVLLHAQQRKKLLQGVLGEAVDVAQMLQKDLSSTAPEAVPKLAKVEAEEATEEPERQSLTTDKLKAVSGPWLLFAITIAGLLYSVAGFLVRRSAAPTRPPSREIALLAIGEP